ncbi:hypothetical protein JVT61DRAFT_9592 [Boletus reticuloceps]|uniref:Uncharacterized protein n=1 Tax=Boletus reticuloceps TaxID=495285 RepID=A0A8I2YFW8_9AGAM|nr:hypothetical protein JVT61DRAFT_9592 [Boletus reticuloceps]
MILDACFRLGLMNIMTKEIKMYGFVMTSILPKYRSAFYTEIPALLASNELVFKEELTKGLEGTGEAILVVQKGTNNGKCVVVVADQ